MNKIAVWVQKLTAPDVQTRLEGIEGLEIIGEAEVLGPLARCFATDPDPQVRQRAAEVGRAIYYNLHRQAATQHGASEAERQRAADILAQAQAKKRRR